MDQISLKRLRGLSERASNNHVIGYGSAEVVIYASEFYALEEAIRELERREKGGEDGNRKG